MQFNTSQDFRLWTSLNNLEFAERFIRNKESCIAFEKPAPCLVFSSILQGGGQSRWRGLCCIQLYPSKNNPREIFFLFYIYSNEVNDVLKIVGSKLKSKISGWIPETSTKNLFFNDYLKGIPARKNNLCTNAFSERDVQFSSTNLFTLYGHFYPKKCQAYFHLNHDII